MRLIRIRHQITTRELAIAVGVSHQYISDLELGKYVGKYDYLKSGEPLIIQAFTKVLANRTEQTRRLADDFAKNRHSLLEFVEDDYEL